MAKQRAKPPEGRAVLKTLRGAWNPTNITLVEKALDAGLYVRKTGDGHIVVRNSENQSTTIASNGSGIGQQAIRKYTADVLKLIANHQAPPPPPEPEVAEGPDLSCRLCDADIQFPSIEALDQHRQSAHWQCPKCGDWLATAKSAGGHTGTKHGGNRPWEKRISSKTRKHRAVTNSRSDEHRCSCGQVFPSLDLLRLHVENPAQYSSDIVTPHPVESGSTEAKNIDDALRSVGLPTSESPVKVLSGPKPPTPATLSQRMQKVRTETHDPAPERALKGKAPRKIEDVELPATPSASALFGIDPDYTTGVVGMDDEAEKKLAEIRVILGQDPEMIRLTRELIEMRVALTDALASVERETRRADEAEARITLMKEAFQGL